MRNTFLAAFVFIVCAALVPFLGQGYLWFLLCSAAVYFIVALSLNILIGIAGQISIGHAAFWALGAYSSAVVVTKLGLPFLAGIPVAGIVAGLVAITPAAGSVTPAWSLVFGAGGSAVCYLFVVLKEKMGYDDTLDVFGIHGAGGIFGALLVGFAATDTGGFGQFAIQFKSVAVAILLSASITAGLVWLVEHTVGFRADEEDELAGLDYSQHGEVGYGHMNL